MSEIAEAIFTGLGLLLVGIIVVGYVLALIDAWLKLADIHKRVCGERESEKGAKEEK